MDFKSSFTLRAICEYTKVVPPEVNVLNLSTDKNHIYVIHWYLFNNRPEYDSPLKLKCNKH